MLRHAVITTFATRFAWARIAHTITRATRPVAADAISSRAPEQVPVAGAAVRAHKPWTGGWLVRAFVLFTAITAGAWSQTHAQSASRTLVSNLDAEAPVRMHITSASLSWLGDFDIEILNDLTAGQYGFGYKFHSVDLLLSTGPGCTDPDARVEVELWQGDLLKTADLLNTGSEPGEDFEVRRFVPDGSAALDLNAYTTYTVVVTTTSDQPECLRLGLTEALSSTYTNVIDYDDDSVSDWAITNGIAVRRKNSNVFSRPVGGRLSMRMRVNGAVNTSSTSLRRVIVRDAEGGTVQTTDDGAGTYSTELQPETGRVSIVANPTDRTHATVRYLDRDGNEFADANPATRRLDIDVDFGTTTVDIEVTAGNATTVRHYTLTLVRPEPACDAPNLVDRRQIWTGLLAPAPDGGGSYGFAAATALGTLSDTTFGVGGARRVVEAVTVSADGTLELRLDEPLDDATPTGLQLHVCDAAFALQEGTHSHSWQSSGLDWSYAPTRKLRLSVPGDEVESIDTSGFDNALRLRVGVGWTGMNGSRDYVWRFRLALEAGQDYRIEARGAGDETLLVFSEDGAPIASESGPGLAWAIIEHTAGESADVLVSVTGARRIRAVDADTPPHTLDEVVPFAGRTDCHDSIDTYHNCAASLGDARSGRIGFATDRDVWGSVVAGGKTYRIEVHPFGREGLAETRVEVFDYATKGKIAETSATNGIAATTIDAPAGAISTYHIRVSGVLAAGGAGEYAVVLSEDGLEPARLSVGDAEVAEAAGATLAFAVTLSPARAAPTRVGYASADGTARAGEDYSAVSGTLEFAAGEKAAHSTNMLI